jgi:hypothetical protein
MSENEETALQAIHQDLDLIREICQYFEGHVLQSTGDGLILYFFSAIQAVECALEIQKTFVQFSREHAIADHFTHRIGIHLGDVYLNQADAVGAGINIAAQLEAACEPTGVCISQTVYDVVKSRLTLNARFLGGLPLKQSPETVLAYQLHLNPSHLEPQPADRLVAPPTATPTQPVVEPIARIAAALEKHDDRLRIKKLIFSACQHVWENDPAALQPFPLSDLIESLRQRHPTLEQCKASLYKIVATLNRKVEYARVAEVILSQVAPLFQAPTRLALAPPPGHRPTAHQYQQVADTLNQSIHRERIKKVLYFLCHHTWESDSKRLQQLDSAVLLEQLCQIAATPQDLQYRLQHLLQHINRQAQYQPVAETLFQQCQNLYCPAPEPSLRLLDRPDHGDTGDAATDPITQVKTSASAPADHTVARAPTALQGLPVAAATAAPDRSDLFDLRQSIIKYCNPLRAKILLHSVLYGPFGYSDQEWLTLKAKTLDSLVRDSFEYCPHFTDLVGKLEILAHCLEDSTEAAQVSRVIAEAIKPYYPPADPQPPPCPENGLPVANQPPPPTVSIAVTADEAL